MTANLRIAVVSDLHANGRALRAAMRDVEDASPDALIVLGDLLTYGVDVEEVLDIVSAAVRDRGASVVLGNHDQLYLDLAEGRTDYVVRLPEWIRESAEQTARALDAAAFRARFPWVDEVTIEGALLAHANPFGRGDWSYLNSDDDVARAARTVSDRGARVGVFGHNHRAVVRAGDSAIVGPTGGDVELTRAPVVVNAGSIGQPRHEQATSTWALLDIGASTIRVSIRRVDYDVNAHCASLARAGLSEPTVRALTAFFRPRAMP